MQLESRSPNLLEEVIELTGLARIIARGTVNRALESVGADVENATPEDYVAALPELRKRIAAFITAADASKKLDAMERRLRRRAGVVTGPFRAIPVDAGRDVDGDE
jgi:hypothetical protein